MVITAMIDWTDIHTSLFQNPLALPPNLQAISTITKHCVSRKEIPAGKDVMSSEANTYATRRCPAQLNLLLSHVITRLYLIYF